MGKGCFLLFCDGVSYSHLNEDSSYNASLGYSAGDVIRVETKQKVLLFYNETRKYEHTLELNLTEDEWNQACFCVSLLGCNGSVSIMWK